MKRTLLASTLAFTAISTAQAAQAQQACITLEDAADTVVYLTPIAYDGALRSCKSELPDDSFLSSDDGKAFADKFRAKQDAAWPGTFRAVQVMMAGDAENDGMAQMIGSMEPEQLRPFADALIGQLIAEEIKPDTCGKIDRGVELLSPLPAENVGGLVSFALDLVGGDSNDLPICNADGTVRVIPEGPLEPEDKAARTGS
ncbi:MAG: hypothetical protein AAF249_04865 [Pseudomonadota bacterium]